MIRLLIFFVFGLVIPTKAVADDIDSALSQLAEQLTAAANDAKKTKVTVIDFVDLQGRQNELGRYIAEQLTVNLVLGRKTFAVLDRANLNSILAEHKLTAHGLVDPENAKRLGTFAGVDAIILGTMIPKKTTVSLTARIITTDTAEIVGAAKLDFDLDESIQQLIVTPAEAGGGAQGKEDSPESTPISKWFDDFGVGVHSLTIVDGRDYLLTLAVTNRHPEKKAYAAIRGDQVSSVTGAMTDPEGNQFLTDYQWVKGLAVDSYQHEGFFRPTVLGPKEGCVVVLRLYSRRRVAASPGGCNLQLEFLVGTEWSDNFGKCRVFNFVTNVQAK